MLNANRGEAAAVLSSGGVGVIPTDTLYGVVGSAFSREAVERIYEIRDRSGEKPFIILVGSRSDPGLFGVEADEKTREILRRVWPGPVSVVLPCAGEKFFYLRCGGGTLAFRFPNDPELLALLKKTGPLVAPSANPEGKPPAKTVEEARRYFGNGVDFYLDGGTLDSLPSTLIRVGESGPVVLREGAVKF